MAFLRVEDGRFQASIRHTIFQRGAAVANKLGSIMHRCNISERCTYYIFICKGVVAYITSDKHELTPDHVF